MKKEADVKEALKRIIRKHGGWYTMPTQTGYSQAGVPDFLVCINGRMVGIEAKFGRNRPTALQERQLRLIEQAGGVAMVANERNLGEVESTLFALSEGKL